MKPLPKFTAVIHVLSSAQALEQTEIALQNGAEGIFLINHDQLFVELQDTYRRVRLEYPSAWIGVNYLDLDARKASVIVDSDVDGLWLDNAEGFDKNCFERSRNWRVFAGAAFKYQYKRKAPSEEAVEVASQIEDFDVVTTSGPATGKQATIYKVSLINGVIQGRLLALASGVTVDNVGDYLPYVDCFLVATGISKSFHELDPAKVRALADKIKQYERAS